MPVMIDVKSSNIEAIGYDSRRRELFVKFRDDGNRLYKYIEVPKLVFTCFKIAGSKKAFLKESVIPYFRFTIVADRSMR